MSNSQQILIAIDSFKGCLTSAEAGRAAAEGAEGRKCRVLTVSDGGDGMLGAFCEAYKAETISCKSHDALMRPIQAAYGLVGNTAIIETAQACGLDLLQTEELNAVNATSYGVGELLLHALRSGARHFIVGLGGTATTDGGFGMLKALISHYGPKDFFDNRLAFLRQECEWTLASDVRNPLCGPQGAAFVFGPQKGASPDEVLLLDARLQRLARHAAHAMGYDCSAMPGAGAAGGLGYAFLQFFRAGMKSGAELLFDTLHFDALLQQASMVITGEGASDAQTLMGKLPSCVLQRAQRAGVPCYLMAGKIADREALLKAGFRDAVCINPPDLSLEEAIKPEVAKNQLRTTMSQLLRSLSHQSTEP